MRFHRAPDAFVTFHVKRGEQFLGCSVKVEDLESMFPQFRHELETDSYFSINAFYRVGYGQGLAGFPNALRKADAARYLNACYCDVDVHEGVFDFWATIAKIGPLFDAGVLPPASIIARSGRGLWLFWLLVDRPGSAMPPTAHTAQRILYGDIQRELGIRLAPIGADLAASDVARITRVPGSFNSHSSTRVEYLLPANPNLRGYSYTLEGIATFLSVPIPHLRPSRRRDPALPASVRGLTGHRALGEYRAADFERLRGLRGGFREGCRNSAAYIYAKLLRTNRLDDTTIHKAVADLGRECRPPLTPKEVEWAVRQSKRPRILKDSTIAAKLKVTREESRLIPRWGGIEFAHVTPKQLNPAQRRATILEISESLGRRLPCREMARVLRGEGIAVNHVTVSRDYQKLVQTAAPLFEEMKRI
jgi:hypothetical protein